MWFPVEESSPFLCYGNLLGFHAILDNDSQSLLCNILPYLTLAMLNVAEVSNKEASICMSNPCEPKTQISDYFKCHGFR